MSDDKEIARQALDFQARARDYGLMSIPGYMVWSKRVLEREPGLAALIAHLDATSMTLLPEELSTVTEQDFEELLEDLKREINDAA